MTTRLLSLALAALVVATYLLTRASIRDRSNDYRSGYLAGYKVGRHAETYDMTE